MVNKLLHDSAKKLTKSDTPFLDARVLLSSVTKVNDAALLFRDLTDEEIALFNKYIKMRQEGIPVAYIIGEKEFMGYSFFVDDSTLIPRPDTECLVEKVIEASSFKSPKILDLCTGSGCIGISLCLMLENSTASLTDISQGALNIANKNAQRHNLSDRIKVYPLDVLNDSIDDTFDIITANPPYIPTDIATQIDVSLYEPVSALDGGKDGLDFYSTIVNKSFSSLKDGGILALEIGYDQGESVPKLLKDFSKVNLYKDYGENDRVVIGTK